MDSPPSDTRVSTDTRFPYRVQTSHELSDPDWDAFLENTPGGHHVQTSLWAQVKALLGWRARRVIVSQGSEIIAGAQLLIRPLPLVGNIGYVPRGPLFSTDDPAVHQLVIAELHRLARQNRVPYLVLQPASTGESLAQRLPDMGFRPSNVEVAPTTTVIIDLTMDLDTILARMKKKTRKCIRRGLREGIHVREGNASDLPTFYHLLTSTGHRHRFSPYPETYFGKMWRVLHPHGYIKLFIAEYQGEAVSALLAIPFGDTVLSKVSGWSGRHGKRRPNEVLDWSVIKWAKSQGYRYYDFEGINPAAARALLHGQPLPDFLQQTATSFKLGFGGQVTMFPGAYEYVYNPLVRWAYQTVLRRFVSPPAIKKAVEGVANLVRAGRVATL